MVVHGYVHGSSWLSAW